MPWTESRSRDEWLEEVRRRGEGIRRRRRRAICAAGVLGLLLPGLAFASATRRGDVRSDVQFATAGPPGTTSADGDAASSAGTDDPTATGEPGGAGSSGGTPPASPAAPTTAEVPHRGATANGSPVEDPAVRPSPPSASADGSLSQGSPAAPLPPQSTNAPSAAVPPLAACPPAQVHVTVVTDKAVYAQGETVRWTSTLENRSGTTCLVSGRAFFRVDDAAGRTVGAFPHTADFQMPVRAEPGKTFTSGLSWDQKDCGTGCVQVPTGTYVVVAEWTEAGPYRGQTSFRIGA